MMEEIVKNNYTSKFPASHLGFTPSKAIFLDFCLRTFKYKIFTIVSTEPFKIKLKKLVEGRPIRSRGTPKRDENGKIIYKPFGSFEEAKEHAKNYLKNHL